jgi:tetrahydromethanopterin S-methyltransferase subunit E
MPAGIKLMIGKAIKMSQFEDYLFMGVVTTIIVPIAIVGVVAISPIILIGYTFCKIMDTLDKPLF